MVVSTESGLAIRTSPRGRAPVGSSRVGELRFGVHEAIAPRRHLAHEHARRRLRHQVVRARPVREVEHRACGVDVVLHDPRERSDVRVQRPLRAIAVAVEARAYRELARRRRIPVWLLDDRRVRRSRPYGTSCITANTPMTTASPIRIRLRSRRMYDASVYHSLRGSTRVVLSQSASACGRARACATEPLPRRIDKWQP